MDKNLLCIKKVSLGFYRMQTKNKSFVYTIEELQNVCLNQFGVKL